MSHGRGSDINTLARLRAVCSSVHLVRLAARLDWDHDTGRRCDQPLYVLLGFGTLARLARSGVRVEYDLADRAVWGFARRLWTETVAAAGVDTPPPPDRPPRWDHWRWVRDHHLATDDGLGRLGREFPAQAAALAHEIGLAHPGARGSFTHPDPTQCIYGDGTQVRPMYKPPAAHSLSLDDGATRTVYPDPRTGELRPAPTHRYDPDLPPHHGQSGPTATHGYVAWHARGAAPYQRVVLAAAHIPAPGREAATAVALAGDVHRHLGDGIKAAIYDGAMHGVHIEEMMRRYGWLVLAKTPAHAATGAHAALFVNLAGKRARSYPLGAVTHDTPTGPCHHQLAAIDGQVVELGIDETGDPVVVAVPDRGPVKRSRRRDGRYYFNVGYRIGCPAGPFTTWLSPHPGPGDDAGRPHNLRIIHAHDPDFAGLHGLRNDSENFHANYKRTLLVDRAMSLGWRRGLLDVFCYALLNNAVAEYRHRSADASTPRTRPQTRPATLRSRRPS